MEDINPSFWQFSVETVLPRLSEGVALSLKLLGASTFFGILLGLLIAFMKMSSSRILRIFATCYITLFRGTPLLLQVLFFYFALPPLLNIKLDEEPAGILALSLNAAAYLAEIFRSGIQSIDLGQTEAARALGMNHALAMRRVILPQAFRRLIPPIVNEIAALAKDTSLVSAIGLAEILFITQRLGAKFFRPWEVYFWASLFYLLVVMALTTVAHQLEKRLKV